MLTSDKLSLFHYVYGPLIQHPTAESGENLIASGLRIEIRIERKKKDKQLTKTYKIVLNARVSRFVKTNASPKDSMMVMNRTKNMTVMAVVKNETKLLVHNNIL